MAFSKAGGGVLLFAPALALIASGCRPDPPHAIVAEVEELSPRASDGDDELPVHSALTPEKREYDSITVIDWPAKIKPNQLRSSVKSAVDYLVRTTDEQGKFAYIVNVDPAAPPTDEYNVVRHAGTMYGLGMYLERYDEDAEAVRAALLRQGKFLQKQIQPVTAQQGMLAIWSEPSVTGLEGPRRAELGSAALGLIGLSCVERESPGSVPREELAGLAEFILFMQDDDGSFAARYVPEEGGKQSVPVLLFYPGEAALALVLLYEVDHNKRWLEAAAQAIANMAQRRDAIGRPVLDHWMLLATGRIWPHYDKTSRPASRQELIRYSVELCERLMLVPGGRTPDAGFKGCITCNGLTCPTATRVEGLVAALAYLPADEAVFRAKVERVSEDAILFLLASQIDEGKYRGGIPYAMLGLPKRHPWRREAYDKSAGEIRIDYVHHAISGMMLYEDVVLKRSEKAASSIPFVD